jgi:hypothetical protein
MSTMVYLPAADDPMRYRVPTSTALQARNEAMNMTSGDPYLPLKYTRGEADDEATGATSSSSR